MTKCYNTIGQSQSMSDQMSIHMDGMVNSILMSPWKPIYNDSIFSAVKQLWCICHKLLLITLTFIIYSETFRKLVQINVYDGCLNKNVIIL